VYLDHWAIRRLAKRERNGEREHFLETFETRGTLMFSVMNAFEIAGNSGDSYTEIRTFLDLLGPHWLFTDVDPAACDTAIRGGIPPPSCFLVPNEQFAALIAKSPELESGRYTLGTALDVVQTPRFQALLGGRRAAQAALVALINASREQFKAGRPFATPPGPKGLPMWINLSLIQYLIKEGKEVAETDVRDLLHAIVPLACAHIVTLDKAWVSLASKLKLDNTRLFSSKNFGDALKSLREMDISGFRTLTGQKRVSRASARMGGWAE
jgi:hypothetical protein